MGGGMRESLKGHMLPESYEDALALRQMLLYPTCFKCKRSLSEPGAARTAAGWKETQISGMCEPCFDAVFADPPDEGSPPNLPGEGNTT
jgi:hypothetical protein